MTTPPTPLHYATTSWLAVLSKAGICLQTVAGTDPTQGRCGEALELTRRFVREWDAEEHLAQLSKRDGRDLELQRHPSKPGHYDVYEHMPSGCPVRKTILRGSGETPAKAIADAMLVLTP